MHGRAVEPHLCLSALSVMFFLVCHQARDLEKQPRISQVPPLPTGCSWADQKRSQVTQAAAPESHYRFVHICHSRQRPWGWRDRRRGSGSCQTPNAHLYLWQAVAFVQVLDDQVSPQGPGEVGMECPSKMETCFGV